MNLKALFPCSFTVGNLLCGFLAIVQAVEGNITVSAWLIALGAIFDGLDGSLARAIHGNTRFGREFDSFADFVTFGVAPMAMIYRYSIIVFDWWALLGSALFLVAGAYRLIRHNLSYTNDSPQPYVGLPITSSGICLAGFVLFSHHFYGHMAKPALLAAMAVVLILLMVSTIAFPRFRLFKRNSPIWLKFLLSISFALALIAKPQVMIFVMIMAYILIVLVLEAGRAFIGIISRIRTGRT